MEVELIVSLALLGAFIGSLIAGPLSDRFGRKAMIMVADVMFTAGSLTMMLA